MVVLYSSAPKSILRTVVSPSALYRGGLWYTGRGGVAPNRCKMGHSELQKIDQTVKKRSEIRAIVARIPHFLVIEIHSMCHGANPNIDRSNKKLQMPFRISNIFFQFRIFSFKRLVFSFKNGSNSNFRILEKITGSKLIW